MERHERVGDGGSRSLAQHIARLLDGRADVLAVQLVVAGHRDGAGGEVDVDVGDAVDDADLCRDRGDAVAAGHPFDGVAGGGHCSAPLCGWVGDQVVVVVMATGSPSSAASPSGTGIGWVAGTLARPVLPRGYLPTALAGPATAVRRSCPSISRRSLV